MDGTVRSSENAGACRILIVEDELLLARDIAYMLRDMGCVVVGIAATAEDAVEQARSLRPDLVFMDIRLKGLKDGIEAAVRIRDLFGLPYVFVTAQTDESMLERARATHPVGFIFKPFAEWDLLEALRNAGLPASSPAS